MDGAVEPFRAVVAGLTFHPPALGLVSDVTGAPLTYEELREPDYWARQLTSPVRFADAVGTLHAAGVRAYVEVGPDAVLTSMVPGVLPDEEPVAVPALVRDRPARESLAALVARLHTVGAPVRWDAWYDTGGTGPLPPADLPTYPFEHTRHWWTGVDVPAGPAPRAEVTALTPALREASLLDLVREHAADVLGHGSADAIDAEANFLEIGFSSFTALEVRNRLCEVTGLLLPPVLLYDYPTPAAVAGFLEEQMAAA
jgi:acyl transferase domain-containing protein